jgi:hypothetical protein
VVSGSGRTRNDNGCVLRASQSTSFEMDRVWKSSRMILHLVLDLNKPAEYVRSWAVDRVGSSVRLVTIVTYKASQHQYRLFCDKHYANQDREQKKYKKN